MNTIQKQINYYVFLLVTLCLFVFSVCPAYADTQEKSIESFLADQTVIRVLLDDAHGYGNQAASLNVMARLNQLGFHGTYEIIYPDAETEKVINLFHLPEKIMDTYDYQSSEYGQLRLIKYSAYIPKLKNNMVDLNTFAFTGALESDKMTGCSDNDDSLDCKSLTANLANFTHSKIFLMLNPWMEESGRIIAVSFFEKDDSVYLETAQQYWVMPQISLEQVKSFLTTNEEGKQLLNKKPALSTLIDGMQSQQFNYMAVYGFTITDLYEFDGNTDYFYNMLQVITGVRSAQLSGNSDLAKPTIIAVFYDYDKDMKKISDLISSSVWGSFEKPGAENLRKVINQLGLNQQSVFSIASINDVSTIDKIKALKTGQILLLSMGQLPKQVFDGLYTYTGDNVLPQIREGQNSLNSLLLTGRPHFRCREYWELGFDLMHDQILKSRFEKFYSNEDSGFCNGNMTWNANPEIYREVSNWIIEAHDQQSAFSKYFQDIKQEASKPENDKILTGLKEVLKAYNGKS